MQQPDDQQYGGIVYGLLWPAQSQPTPSASLLVFFLLLHSWWFQTLVIVSICQRWWSQLTGRFWKGEFFNHHAVHPPAINSMVCWKTTLPQFDDVPKVQLDEQHQSCRWFRIPTEKNHLGSSSGVLAGQRNPRLLMEIIRCTSKTFWYVA